MTRRIAVAASGGRDSTALLHATARAARGSDIEVYALHIHHGLMPQADAWLVQIRRQCQRWCASGLPVSFLAQQLESCPAPGDSVEAWARRERYRALADMAHALGIDRVLLAHHRRDQAETLILQALRGGGPAGLSAMPETARRNGVTWHRPWLEHPREAIEAYVRRYRLGFIDDASNTDPRYARSRLRATAWPALVAAFPDAESVLAASARRMGEAEQCNSELAAIDQLAAEDALGRLRLTAWRALSPARQANLLRHWLAARTPRGVPQSLVDRLLDELGGTETRPSVNRVRRWPVGDSVLREHSGLLEWRPSNGSSDKGTVPTPASLADPPGLIDLHRAGRYAVPGWSGRLEVVETVGAGMARHLLEGAECRARQGGEQFQMTARSIPRSLKKQYQARGVPADEREGPLVYADGRLAYVPGLGVDARVQAAPGEPGCVLRWLPWPSSHTCPQAGR